MKKNHRTLFKFVSTLIVISLAVVVSWLSFSAGHHHNNHSSTSSQSTTLSSAKTSSSSSSVAASASSTSNPTSIGSWSSAKDKQLSSFMSSWQTKMSQTYTGTYDGNEPNFYGIAFPAAFSNANAQGHFVFDNTQEDVTWDPTNQSQADLKVLAVAVGHRNDAATALILYFFAVKNGQPVVYVSQTTNGPQVYFQKTDNADLQNGFAKLYNK